MERLQAYKFQLRPKAEQESLMRRFAGCCRFLWNKALALEKETYEKEGKRLGFSGLSFLGLGTAPPFPEWGNMLNDGKATLQTAPWTVIFPGLAILIVVMIMGMFGDSINELLNLKKNVEQ